jgi:hypothetical protein
MFGVHRKALSYQLCGDRYYHKVPDERITSFYFMLAFLFSLRLATTIAYYRAYASFFKR